MYEDEIETENRQKTEIAESRKSYFPQEEVGNANLYKPILNKVMNADDKCVKYNFVAPVNNGSLKQVKLYL